MNRRRTILAAAAILSCSAALSAEPAPRPVTVFAAASLTDVLGKLGEEFTKSTGVPVRFSFASSSIIARQIEAGAGADVFFSADQEWMDYLEQRRHIQKSSRRNVLSNRLALIAPADSKIELTIEPGFPLANALGKGRLATGDPDVVPGGPLRARGTDEPRRLERCRGPTGPCGGRPHCAHVCRPRRSAARHRLCDRRPRRKARAACRAVPGRVAPADHVPRCADHQGGPRCHPFRRFRSQ